MTLLTFLPNKKITHYFPFNKENLKAKIYTKTNL